ncbi:MAG: U32 family peptidase [Thermoguttaceae bacterium]|nr:U32 family peptidase [Thermoguttaceae bacterium]
MKIMAPAGDYERMSAAIAAGADEVYMGIAGFGARRFATNFSVDEYCRALDEAHRYGVRVHLTLNTILSDTEFEVVHPGVTRLYEAGLDAVIVQDFGVVRWLQENFPKLPLHASTQMSLARPNELKWIEEQGFKRAVLARELSFDEIAAIRSQTQIELEVFVSGSLCLSCSGKCYLSSFIGGRSGNRGMCTQPCRQPYKINDRFSRQTVSLSEIDEKYNELRYTGAAYFLSLKDQWQGKKELARLREIGVDSIKIEGRMKSPVYVYEAVRWYRDVLNRLEGISPETAAKRRTLRKDRPDEPDSVSRGTPSDNTGSNDDRSSRGNGSKEFSANGKITRNEERRIDRIFNRGYGPGYLYEHDPDIINRDFSANFGVQVGVIEHGEIRLTESLRNGDGIVYLDRFRQKVAGGNVSQIHRVNRENRNRPERIDEAFPGDRVFLEEAPPVETGYLYRTYDHLLNRELEHAIKQTQRHVPINAELTAKIGRPLSLVLKRDGITAKAESDSALEKSRKISADESSLKEMLDRFGNTPFYLENCKVKMDESVFIPKSLLNQLRQQAAAELEKKLIAKYRRDPQPAKADYLKNSGGGKDFSIPVESKPQEDDDDVIWSAAVRTKEQFDVCRKMGIRKIYPLVPPVRFEDSHSDKKPPVKTDRGLFDNLSKSEKMPEFLLAGSLGDAVRWNTERRPFSLDWTFNIGNREAVLYWADRFPHMKTIFLSPEINERDCQKIIHSLAGFREQRFFRVGLPVYGHLAGMFTRKTLFPKELTGLENQDGRSFIVTGNRNWYPDSADMTGSTVYYGKPLDLIDAIPWVKKTGVTELRFDFTLETAAETLAILKRADHPVRDRYSPCSYGFTHGIF